MVKKISNKTTKKSIKNTTKSKKNNETKDHEGGKVEAYCLPCKDKVTLDKNISLIKRNLPNGNVVTLLCGYCKDCKSKSCKIIANSKK